MNRVVGEGLGGMIIGEKVHLRALTESDSAAYKSWINDRKLVQYNATYTPISDINHNEWFSSVTRNADIAIFSIIEATANSLIGSCSLRHIDHLHKNAELQIRIGKATKRGAGLGTEAVFLLLTHAFNDLNLNRVYLNVFSDNQRAIHAYKKSGMTIEGELRQACFINGAYQNVIVMSILRDEFITKK